MAENANDSARRAAAIKKAVENARVEVEFEQSPAQTPKSAPSVSSSDATPETVKIDSEFLTPPQVDAPAPDLSAAEALNSSIPDEFKTPVAPSASSAGSKATPAATFNSATPDNSANPATSNTTSPSDRAATDPGAASADEASKTPAIDAAKAAQKPEGGNRWGKPAAAPIAGASPAAAKPSEASASAASTSSSDAPEAAPSNPASGLAASAAAGVAANKAPEPAAGEESPYGAPKKAPAGPAAALAADPNAGAAGKGAKLAGAIKGAQGAIEGFNDGGFKGAAAKGAMAAREGAATANAAAAKASEAKNADGKLNMKDGAKLAASGAKAALIAFLVGATGVPPEVWGKVISKKGLLALLILLLFPVVLIAGLFMQPGQGVTPAPDAESEEQSDPYIPDGWVKAVKDASNTTARDTIPIPWTVLAGLAKTGTDFGRTSPYDDNPVDHDPIRDVYPVKNSKDPDNTNLDIEGKTPEELTKMAKGIQLMGQNGAGPMGGNSSCSARYPYPYIGGDAATEAEGPFLLSRKAVEEMEDKDKDPNNPCEASKYLAKKLSAQAVITLEANEEMVDPWSNPEDADGAAADATRKENMAFWAQVISDSGLIQGPGDGSNVGDCAVPQPTDGTELPVPYLIEQIWSCELDLGTPIHIVSRTTETGDVLEYKEVSEMSSRQTIIWEAYSVSYGYSKWDNSTCDPAAKVAGIFPMDSATAASYGVSNRCDPQQNIRGAARAVLEVERTLPAERSTALGKFQPMMGGWANLTNVFGTEKSRIATQGPSSRWLESATCSSAMSGYLTAIVPYAVDFKALWTEDSNAFDDLIYLTKLNAAEAAGRVSYASLVKSCVSVPERQLLNSLASMAHGEANALASEESSAFANSVDTVAKQDTLFGLGMYFDARRDKISGEILPVYGTHSLLSPRLGGEASSVSYPSVGNFSISQPLTTYAQSALDYAIFYGGVTEPFNTVGMLVGSLVGVTETQLGGLDSGQIPAELVPIFLKNGQLCPIVTPAVLAAQAYQESNFNVKAHNSKAGAAGIAQFIPSTWKALGVDGDGDGVIDVYNPHDAIASQAKYMCELAATYADGRYPGDQLSLTLAAYNAGPGKVASYGGIPPFLETQNYVRQITERVALYSATPATVPGGNYDSTSCPTVAPANTLRDGSASLGIAKLCADSVAGARSPQAAQAIIFTFNNLGVPYSQATRNQQGWFDCSSYTSRSYQSAGVNIAPPGQNAPTTRSMRVSRWAVQITQAELMPGDLVQPTNGHVAMQLANGYVIHTNRPGDVSHVRKGYTSIYWAAYVDPAKV